MRKKVFKQDEKKRLYEHALLASGKAYAPYSRFRVGAALMGENGKVYTGVNVESASYGLTLCAERGALARAVADGCRSFRAMACVEKKKGLILPCGACRQMLIEFSPKMKILVRKNCSLKFV
ncbi:MAG: cytidine deaminase, partial [Candidatus Aureabacteria bacterium]|nr:cytidine deaminase [Candidatus Auribacterota bacterium]